MTDPNDTTAKQTRARLIIGGALAAILLIGALVLFTGPETEPPAPAPPVEEQAAAPVEEAAPEAPRLIAPPPVVPPLDSTWKDERKVLRLLAWPDYFAPATLARFEKTTGIKVDYKTFESPDALIGELSSGKTAYDVVTPSNALFSQMGGATAFRRLSSGHLGNRKHMDPVLTKTLAALDPGNDNAAPYFWGTAGIAYHTKTVHKRAGKKAPMDSWEMVFDPRWAERLVDCGLYFPASPDEFMDLALIALGKDPNTENPADYQALEERLLKLRPFISGFHEDGKVEDLKAGTACAVVGWSASLMVAHASSADESGLRAVDYVVPTQGTLLWFDLLAVPKNAAHPGNAHKFIDFMMTPEAGAEASNHVWYATANAAAKDQIDESIVTHPGLYPDPKIVARSFVARPLPEAARKLRDAVWESFGKGEVAPAQDLDSPDNPANLID